MYLYDANNQAQASVAPTYSKHIQTESYSVFLNSNSSSNTEPTTQSGLGNVSANTSASKNTVIGQNYPSSSMLNTGQQSKQLQLNLSNQNQPIQVSKNPLVNEKKIRIFGVNLCPGPVNHFEWDLTRKSCILRLSG